jgi:hypothetical protein
MIVHACHPRDGGKSKIGGPQSRLAWAKSKTLSPKQPMQKELQARLNQ